ncbi:MAG TPA: alkaline phosphatase D family protein [Acidimicrobiia bacterium]|jgi:hypothetical protein|nr:alkaline phosphatase D family protein [Acidimicrobiia bacterium]
MDQPGSHAGRETLVEAVRHHDLDATVLTDALEATFRRWARWWSVAAVAVFGFVAFRYGAPGEHDYVPWQSTASVIALALAVLGLAIAFRHEAIGGSVALVAGVAVGSLAAVEYHPLLALGAAVVFVVPAVLHLLAWHRTQTLRAIVVLGVVILIVMTAGGALAWGFYDHALGPTHPDSAAPPLSTSAVEWLWSGGVTDASAVVVASVPDAADVALWVEPADRGSGELAVPADMSGGVWRFELEDLEPATTYRYTVVADGVRVDDRPGSFTTFAETPRTFTVAVGSCSRLGSNGAVYDAIGTSAPDLYLVTGDFYYGEIIANDIDEFAAAFETTLTQPGQAALHAGVPVAYIWDDHDYGPNDAGADSPSREAALAAFRRFVPHYPLALDGAEAPVAQAFTVGRVRFVLTDLRSAKVQGDSPTMMGDRQLDWFLTELRAAAEADQLVVWVSTVPWIAAASPGADNWGGFAAERQIIAEHIAGTGVELLMLAGDAHMLAIDDGTNSGYAGPGSEFVVMHAAALDRPGSSKGGPYSEGAFPAGGQYGLVTFTDAGDGEVTVTLRGLRWDGSEVVELQHTYDLGTDHG